MVDESRNFKILISVEEERGISKSSAAVGNGVFDGKVNKREIRAEPKEIEHILQGNVTH